MAGRGDEFSFFQGIHVRIDGRIDMSTSVRNHQIWQGGTSTRFDSNLTQTSNTRVCMATKLCRMVTYLDGLLPVKS